MRTEVSDLIYEAAFVPQLWPSVLGRLAQLSTSAGTGLFLFSDGRPTRGVALEHQAEELQAFLASDTLPFSASVQNVCRAQPSSFVDFNAFMTEEERASDLAMQRYESMGIRGHLGTAIPMPSGELVIFVQQRRTDDGPYDIEQIEQLNALRPDIARASMVAVRLGLERARNAVDAMQTMGFAAAVLTESGRVRATNAMFEALSTTFLTTAFGGVALAASKANTMLQQAIRTFGTARGALSIPVPRTDGIGPLVLHLLPLRRAANDIFGGGDIMLVATMLGASTFVPSPTVLTGLFDLTPAEARLATSLAEGLTLKASAAQQGIQFSTARYYLEKIFHKTATHQQSELVALLRSAQPQRS